MSSSAFGSILPTVVDISLAAAEIIGMFLVNISCSMSTVSTGLALLPYLGIVRTFDISLSDDPTTLTLLMWCLMIISMGLLFLDKAVDLTTKLMTRDGSWQHILMEKYDFTKLDKRGSSKLSMAVWILFGRSIWNNGFKYVHSLLLP